MDLFFVVDGDAVENENINDIVQLRTIGLRFKIRQEVQKSLTFLVDIEEIKKTGI